MSNGFDLKRWVMPGASDTALAVPTFAGPRFKDPVLISSVTFQWTAEPAGDAFGFVAQLSEWVSGDLRWATSSGITPTTGSGFSQATVSLVNATAPTFPIDPAIGPAFVTIPLPADAWQLEGEVLNVGVHPGLGHGVISQCVFSFLIPWK